MSQRAVTVAQALAALESLTGHPHHKFWRSGASLVEATKELGATFESSRQVTDAYLMGLATRNGGMLATFDERLLAWARKAMPHRQQIELIPL